MGITTQTLMKERFVLQKSFNEMNSKIQSVEKEIAQMKNNINVVYSKFFIILYFYLIKLYII